MNKLFYGLMFLCMLAACGGGGGGGGGTSGSSTPGGTSGTGGGVPTPSGSGGAQGGALDTTFGTNGKVTTDMGGEYDTARALAIQSDGKIIAAGDAAGDFVLVRYNPDGSLDTTFGTGGKVITLKGTAWALGIQSDGKIVAAGTMVINTYISAYFALARYNTDGSLDTTFGTGGKVTTDFGSYGCARALAIQSDGKIVIAGETTISGGDFTVIRYNTDGSLDTTFDTDGIASVDNGGKDDYAAAIAIQKDGRIVTAGSSAGDFAIIRFNTDGSLDGGIITPVGSYVDKAYAVGIQSDGKIVAAGYVEPDGAIAQFALVRYNTDGTLDTTFGTNGIVTTEIVNASAWAMGIQSDGKIIAAGRTSVGGFYDFALTRYNTNGSLDTTFGTEGIVVTPIGGYTEYALALSIQSDGKIVAAGTSLSGPNNFDFAVVRYLP